MLQTCQAREEETTDVTVRDSEEWQDLPRVAFTRELVTRWAGTEGIQIHSVAQDPQLLRAGYSTVSQTVKIKGRSIDGVLRMPYSLACSSPMIVLCKEHDTWTEHNHPVRYEKNVATTRVTIPGLYTVAVCMLEDSEDVYAPSGYLFGCQRCMLGCSVS